MAGAFAIALGAIVVWTIMAWAGVHAAAPAAMPLRIEDAVMVREFQTQGVPPKFSPDGQWVSATICDAAKVSVTGEDDGFIATQGAAFHSMGCDIWLYPTRAGVGFGVARNLTAEAGNEWGPSWSPDGKSMAFFSDRDGKPGLWLWDRAGDKFRKVTDAVTHHRMGLEWPAWTPDSRTVVVKLRPEGAEDVPKDSTAYSQSAVEYKEPGSTVTVFRSPRPAPQKEDGNKPSPPSPMQADIARVDIASGSVRRLLEDVRSSVYRVSPDGKSLAVQAWMPNHPDSATQLIMVDIASGTVRSRIDNVVQTFPGAFSWSPDSRQIAYVAIDVEARKAHIAASTATSLSPADGGDLFIVAAEGGAPLKVEGAPANTFYSDHLAPLWDERSRQLYLLDESGQVWKVDAAARRAQPLTRDTERAKRVLIPGGDGSLLVRTFNKQNLKNGFCRVDTGSGQLTVLREEDRRYSNLFSLPAVSPDGGQLVYQAESATESVDLWISDVQLRQPRRLSTLNPQLGQYTFGRSRIVDFKNADGTPLKASLLLPATYKPGQRYPTVLWVYASDADTARNANNFGLVSTKAFNMQMLATRGYAVMWPDIPTNKGTPMKDLMKSVMPAIDRLVDLGVTDPDKLAVMGNSNGGYSTLALIAQTKRFKAAVMNAGFGDLTAFHGTMGGVWHPWLESKGGSMGVPPWEAPLRYVENSPIYFLDKVETPLIIQAGTADSGILQHSDQVWVGMQRLNKDATYLRYGGEGHALAATANLKDYWKRVFAFFDRHL